MLDKDEVREIMGGCSDQMAYRVIRELNSELREKGIATVQGKVSKKYLLERYLAERPRGEPSNVGNPSRKWHLESQRLV